MKGKALRRALETDAMRVGAEVPLIIDTTELITPETAHAMLRANKNNRPINWNKVEEYADTMAQGKWELHAQGIVLDTEGNVLTGQKRLWAVIYSGVNVYMRVSRGNPPRVAKLLDRGTPQSARDLATRDTGRKHSPVEASIARAYCALAGNSRPSVDTLAAVIEAHSDEMEVVLRETTRVKKTKALVMVLAAVIAASDETDIARRMAGVAAAMADELTVTLAPQTAEACWGRGAAFGLAMEHARRIVAQRKVAA